MPRSLGHGPKRSTGGIGCSPVGPFVLDRQFRGAGLPRVEIDGRRLANIVDDEPRATGVACDGIHGVRRRGVSRLNSAGPLRISRVLRSPVKSRNPSLRIAWRAVNRRRSACARDPIATTSRDWIPNEVRRLRAPIATGSCCFLRAPRGSDARLRAVLIRKRPPSAPLRQRSGLVWSAHAYAPRSTRIPRTAGSAPSIRPSPHGGIAPEPVEDRETATLSGRGSSASRA